MVDREAKMSKELTKVTCKVCGGEFPVSEFSTILVSGGKDHGECIKCTRKKDIKRIVAGLDKEGKVEVIRAILESVPDYERGDLFPEEICNRCFADKAGKTC
jgi:hypothetical protein